jgi:hypothetical protein
MPTPSTASRRSVSPLDTAISGRTSSKPSGSPGQRPVIQRFRLVEAEQGVLAQRGDAGRFAVPAR